MRHDPRLRWIARYLVDLAGRTYRLRFYMSYANLWKIRAIRRSPSFDAGWYLAAYPDVARRRLDPARHYLEYGDREGRNPGRDFDTRWYRETYPDVARCGENTLVHHILIGAALGRATAPRIANAPWWFALRPEDRAAKEGAAAEPAAPEAPPFIVIPVYNAAEELRACLGALRRNTEGPYRLVLIDDASPDPAIARLLDGIVGWPEAEIHRNAENLGFTRTINRGLALAGRADAVLLNADTEVTPGWLRNLARAAYSAPRIGTVSPFSDNAGAFSAPEMDRENPLPPWATLDEHARAVSQTARRRYPRVPTTSGFCMYVRRACLDAVGILDAEAFPRGYGEENDFCMRAGRAGWEHAIDDATLIHHVRSASFGAAKQALVAQGRAVVDARYPDYGEAIRVFGGEELKACRRRVAAAVAATRERPGEVRPRGLYVVATRTGGTPQTNEDLMAALSDEVETFVLWSNAARMSLQLYRAGAYLDLASHGLAEPIKAFPHRSVEYDRVLRRWLVEHAIEFVHIRHLAWHSLGLIAVAKDLGLPVIFSVHDFYTLCPTVKLLDENGRHCGGTCTPSGGECGHELWTELDFPPLKHRAIHDWQRAFAEVLARCDAFVTTTESARATFLAKYPALARRRFEIIPHGRDFVGFESLAGEWRPGEPVRLLVPGNISVAKGGAILRALGDRTERTALEIHVLGNIDSRTRLKPVVTAHGPYAREEFAAKVREIRPHLGAVLSIWPETYCHTLTEMWACGVPVVGYDLGAVGDRIRASGAGWLAETRDGAELGRFLLGEVRDEAGLRARREAVAAWQRGEGLAHSTRFMAARYFALYGALLRGETALLQAAPHPGAPQAITAPGDPGDNPFAAAFAEAGRPVGAEEVVALVCPCESLTRGYASTYVRVWERARNRLGQHGCFLRCTAEELVALAEIGAVARAVIQRDAVPAALAPRLAELCAAGRLEIVVDLDDNLLEVPADKDPRGRYAAYRPALEALLGQATAITVSTPSLAEVYAGPGRRTLVVPNRLSRRLWGVPPAGEAAAHGRTTVLYMGTKTHDADLALVLPAFEALARRHKGLRLRVIGGFATAPGGRAALSIGTLPAWLETVELENAVKPYPAFVPWLRNQVADVDFAIAPLADTAFNRWKSGLKFLDYAALGLSGLYTDLPEYRALAEASSTGILVAPEADWTGPLEAALTDLPGLRAAGARARAWVEQTQMVPAQHLGADARGTIVAAPARDPVTA